MIWLIFLFIFYFLYWLFKYFTNQVIMNIKYTYSTILVLLFLFIAYGSGEEKLKQEKLKQEKLKQEDLVGWTYDLDSYHRIKFESKTSYRIWQKPLNCGGSGSWSFQNGKIILGSNSSNCSSTRDIAGNKYVKGSKGKLQLVN